MRPSIHLALACVIVPALAWGQYGALDESFNGLGYNYFGQLTLQDRPTSVFQRSDGRITVSSSTAGSIGVNQLMPDGTLDLSFGSEGYLYYSTAAAHYGGAMVELSNDKLMVVGMGADDANSVRFMRLLANGQFDNSFGTAGVVTSLFVGFQKLEVKSIARMTDGRTWVAGSASTDTTRMFLARFLANGSPDMGFNGTGIRQYDVLEQSYVNDMLVRPDGKVLLAGNARGTGNKELALLQLTAAGDPDASFGTQGIVTMDLDYVSNEIMAITLAADGSVLGCGGVYITAGDAMSLLIRFDANGQLDPAFGLDGWFVKDLGSDFERYNDVIFDTDATFLATAQVSSSGSSSSGLAIDRYYLDGTAETTFGTNGSAAYTFGTGNKLALQSDGKILVAGQKYGTSTVNAHVARFTPGIITSVPEINGQALLNAFPNPTTDRVFLELPHHIAPWEIRVLDAHGREVHRAQLSVADRAELLVQDLAPGAYQVLLSTGAERYRAAFVKVP